MLVALLHVELSTVTKSNERLVLLLDNFAVVVDKSKPKLRLDIWLDHESTCDSFVQS